MQIDHGTVRISASIIQHGDEIAKAGHDEADLHVRFRKGNPMSMAFGCMTAVLVMSIAGQSDKGLEKGQSLLLPFDYHGVVLHDSLFKMQFDEVRDFYLRLPNDDILRGYRLRAGLPAPGVELTGCYIGHNAFGQVLSGLARMYAATGDVACKEKAEALMEGWAECLGPDGFFFIDKAFQLPAYYYDKIVCGLLDLYVYCGNQKALGYLGRVTDWAIENLDRSKPYARPTGAGGGEWYTLGENLYRAWLATADEKYRDFAEIWEYKEFWDLFLDKSDIFAHPLNGGWYHAYSHVNSLNGLAGAYLVKGDARYLDALRNAYDFLWETQLWATGGFGPNETLMPRSQLAGMLNETANHFETQCGSWAGFKMCKYLIRLTGDARYGDWMELLAINGIGASIPMDPDGSVFYYSEYRLSGSAKQNMAPWACCSGTRPQAVADFHDIIYFAGEKSLHVNLFIPSSVEWQCGDSDVRVTQRTRFPLSDEVELEVSVRKPIQFGLNIRMPGWLASPMTASINQEAVPVSTDERHWAVFHRKWRDGDRLLIRLPMGFNLSRIATDKDFPAALRYGPVVLVARSPKDSPPPGFDPSDPAGSLEAVSGSPLNYRLKADPSVLVRPFFQMRRGEEYFMYLDPYATTFRQSFHAATFSPGWTTFGGWNATCAVGSTVQYAFEGTNVAVIGQFYDDAGRFEVNMDGQVIGVIDQYGPERGRPGRWEFADLAQGAHVMTLTLLPDKSNESKGNWVNLAAFEVTR